MPEPDASRPQPDALAWLHALEWRYDGPIPAAALTAIGTAPATLAGRRAAADGAVIDRLARDSVRALAASRRHTGPGRLAALDGSPAAARLAAARAIGLCRRA